MDKKKLYNYRKMVKKWHKIMKGNRYNLEENTMIKIVIPFFEMLGWNRLSEDMEFEYPITKRNKKLGFADIALYAGNLRKPKILVEVKQLQKNLGKGTQLFKYLKAKKINYGIYTNGNELILIDKRYTKPYYYPNKMLFIRLLDKSMEKYENVLTIFSKKSVKGGRLGELARAFHHEYGRAGYGWTDYYKRLDFALNFLNK
jgi:hypothetical protein